MLAPRAVYTIGDDEIKERSHRKDSDLGAQEVTERTGLLVNQQTMTTASYSTEQPPRVFYREDAGDDAGECGGTLTKEIQSSGDPLTGKLFGRSAMEQVMTSWFWCAAF